MRILSITAVAAVLTLCAACAGLDDGDQGVYGHVEWREGNWAVADEGTHEDLQTLVAIYPAVALTESGAEISLTRGIVIDQETGIVDVSELTLAAITVSDHMGRFDVALDSGRYLVLAEVDGEMRCAHWDIDDCVVDVAPGKATYFHMVYDYATSW